MQKHKETCLKINGKQSVKLRSDLFKFKNYFKQLNAPFKIYPDFESLLKGVQSNDRNNSTSYNTLKNIKNTFLVALLIKLFCVDDKFSKSVVLYRGKNTVSGFIQAILKENDCCKKIIKNLFNKNLVLSEEDEESFQLSNKFWISDKLFDAGYNKVRNHCYVTGKCRGSVRWSIILILG